MLSIEWPVEIERRRPVRVQGSQDKSQRPSPTFLVGWNARFVLAFSMAFTLHWTGASPLHGQSSAEAVDTYRHVVSRIPNQMNRPTLDGVLDDSVWEIAKPLSPLTQVRPIEGAPPSERTDIRFLYDRDSLFLGIRFYHRDPSRIRATVQKRDEFIESDDRISFMLSPQLDGVNGYGFVLGAAGGRFDTAIVNDGRLSPADYEWVAKTTIDDEGWVAEIELPFTEFSYTPGQTEWGFNIERDVAHGGETIRWAAPRNTAMARQPSYAGILEGFEDIGGGSQVDVKPFVVGEYSRIDKESDVDFEAGIDLFYKITPRHKFSLSVNTDFAETEVDDRVVNLTRFPLFFPERRDFFIEDAGVFQFGPVPRDPAKIDAIPFFSRTIGLDAQGMTIPLNVAGKFTKTGNRLSYGVLYTRTGSEGSLDRQDLAVGRASVRFFNQSDAGVLWTYGDPLDRDRESTVGVDVNLRTRTFRGDKNLNWSTFYLQSYADGTSSEHNSFRTSLEYPNDEIELAGTIAVVGEDFDPALGFVPRRGVRKYRGVFAWRPRPQGDTVRQWDFRFEPEFITGNSNKTESVRLHFRPLGLEFEAGDVLSLDFTSQREILDDPFPIQSLATVPPGSSSFNRYGPRFRSSHRRPLAATAAVTFGGFFDGHRQDYLMGLDYRPGRLGSIAAEYEASRIRVAGEEFSVRVARVRANLQFSPEVTWTNFAQWDNLSELISLNSRLRWALRDGQEANLVLNKGWIAEDGLRARDERVTLKLIYTFFF